jgi:myosin heavy subunit
MDAETRQKFKELTSKPYADQAIWFLNGFWHGGAEQAAEDIWRFTQKFIELDEKKKKGGSELDEFKAHVFLEQVAETHTVLELRQKLRKMDIDDNKHIALSEYLLFKYDKAVKPLVNAPQGDNAAELERAQKKLEEVQNALDELQRAEVSLKKAEAELKVAVKELKAQEDAYNNKIAELEGKVKDLAASTVSKNKAANELAQLKGEDPLPLRRAKITQEAALRKVEKEKKITEERKAEALVRFDEAVKYLEEVRSRSGSGQGAVWWMQRELKEKQKYLPQRLQK